MKIFIGAATTCCGFLLFAALAVGAETGKTPVTETSRAGSGEQEKMIDAKGKKISVVNFDDAVIEGKARGPDGFVLKSREASGARSVLELRRDFRAETLSDALGGVPVVPNSP